MGDIVKLDTVIEKSILARLSYVDLEVGMTSVQIKTLLESGDYAGDFTAEEILKISNTYEVIDTLKSTVDYQLDVPGEIDPVLRFGEMDVHILRNTATGEIIVSFEGSNCPSSYKMG